MASRWLCPICVNTVSDLTGTRFESPTSRSRDKPITARPTGRLLIEPLPQLLLCENCQQSKQSHFEYHHHQSSLVLLMKYLIIAFDFLQTVDSDQRLSNHSLTPHGANQTHKVKSNFSLCSMHYDEACNEFARSISASLRPGTTAPFEEILQWLRAVDNA